MSDPFDPAVSVPAQVGALFDAIIGQFPMVEPGQDPWFPYGRGHNVGLASQSANGAALRTEDLCRLILRQVEGLPTEAATAADVVQAAEDAIDRIVTALDGLVIDGRQASGADARALLLELLGAAE